MRCTFYGRQQGGTIKYEANKQTKRAHVKARFARIAHGNGGDSGLFRRVHQDRRLGFHFAVGYPF